MKQLLLTCRMDIYQRYIDLRFGGYLLSSLSGTVEWLSGPSKLLPFHYYQSEAILRDSYNYANLLYFAAVTVLSLVLANLAFNRRDID